MTDHIQQAIGIPTHKHGIWTVEMSCGGHVLSRTHEADERLQTVEQVKALAISRLDFKITFENLKP